MKNIKKLLKTNKIQITMKKVENIDTINHDLLFIDVDLQKCLNCSFTIQKIDDVTINTGDKNCVK